MSWINPSCTSPRIAQLALCLHVGGRTCSPPSWVLSPRKGQIGLRNFKNSKLPNKSSVILSGTRGHRCERRSTRLGCSPVSTCQQCRLGQGTRALSLKSLHQSKAGNTACLAGSRGRAHSKLFHAPGTVLPVLLQTIWAGLLPWAPAHPAPRLLPPGAPSVPLTFRAGEAIHSNVLPLGSLELQDRGPPDPLQVQLPFGLAEREGRQAAFENHSPFGLSPTWGQGTEATSSYFLPQFTPSPGEASLYLVRKY